MPSLEAFRAARQGGYATLAETAPDTAPKPSAIPPRERRRAGLAINLAVEVAHQACRCADVDIARIPSVFTSALGDTAVTDYMCKALVKTGALLSPTKFHNSVHNAGSGHWSISAANHNPSTFVGSFPASFGIALFEAASQVSATEGPVLLVASDIANKAPLSAVCPIEETLGVAFVLAPSARRTDALARFALRFVAEGAFSRSVASADRMWSVVPHRMKSAQGTTPESEPLAKLAARNPIGAALALVERFVEPASGPPTMRFAAGANAHVELRRSSPGADAP